jgi:drug/metabolite transporter (DMT)-like permease
MNGRARPRLPIPRTEGSPTQRWRFRDGAWHPDVGGPEHDGQVTRRGLFLFVALGIAWGIPYLFIKVAVSELEPAMVVLSRAGLAAVPLAGVGVGFLLGRPAKLSGVNWVGILLGMSGVAALVGFEVGGSDLLAVVEVAIVVLGYALGPAILAKWVPELPGVGVTAVSLSAAALVYIPFVALTGAFPTEMPSVPVIVSLVVLAVVCSALAFVLMVALVGEIGPVRMSAITYVNPAVAILAGAIFLGERITVWTILGFALVLSGSYLVTRRRREVVAPAGPEEAAAEVDSLTPSTDGERRQA